MGSCALIRVKTKAKQTAKTMAKSQTLRDKLIQHILSLHRLSLDCKIEIEDCTLKKAFDLAVAIKQKQLHIEQCLTEARDLLVKIDEEADSMPPDKMMEKYLNGEASKHLKKCPVEKLAAQINEIMNSNNKMVTSLRRNSEKLVINETMAPKELANNEGGFTRKRYRKRRNSAC